MNNMKEVELLRCPFCGEKAEKIRRCLEYPYIHAVWCSSCHCRTSFGTSEGEAVKIWNNRKPMEQVIEQLETERINSLGESDDYMLKRAVEIVEEVLLKNGE